MANVSYTQMVASMRVRALIAALGFVALTACATNVQTFYTPVPHRSDDAPLVGEPELRPGSGDTSEDIAGMFSGGYELIGYSAYNGPEGNKAQEIDQAKKVGAQVVLYGVKYTDTANTGAVGGTTFTRYGAFSFAVPTSVRRYDQVSLFFAKAPRIGLGVAIRLIKPEEATQLGTNKGMRVTAVVRGSPAFDADVLPGDILESVNDRPTYDADTTTSAAKAAYGTDAKLVILRNGQTIEKTVDVPLGGVWK